MRKIHTRFSEGGEATCGLFLIAWRHDIHNSAKERRQTSAKQLGTHEIRNGGRGASDGSGKVREHLMYHFLLREE